MDGRNRNHGVQNVPADTVDAVLVDLWYGQASGMSD